MSSARRPSSVSRIARARSASPRCSDFDRARKAACSAASAVSFDFPAMLGLHSPHARQTIFSVVHSQAACLVHSDHVRFGEFYLFEKYQRQGLGTRILTHVLT